MLEPEGRAAVELYQDPTLEIGPDIVKSVVSQFIDGFAGSRIAIDVIEDQLGERGVSVDAQRRQEIMMHYAGWSAELGQRQEGGGSPLIDRRAASQMEGEAEGLLTQILRPIMTGMMIFYAFFTAANAGQSILAEEEAGTLPRLFTTPTPLSTILGGKLLAIFATILVQVVVLVVIGALVFDMAWGAPLPLMLAVLGLVILASSFGIFLVSLLKNTKQVGVVFGGVMTVTGLVGINAMFTGSLSGTSKATDIMALLTPQGWAMRGWSIVIEGGGVADLLLPLGVMVVLGAVFFAVGVGRFRDRFG
jgi:ABC-type Na+ efflux pump permease subunit